MAIGTDFNLQVVADRRTCLETVTAGTGDGYFFVLWVDSGFHDEPRNKYRQNRQAHSYGPYRHASTGARILTGRYFAHKYLTEKRIVRHPGFNRVGAALELSTKSVDKSVDAAAVRITP